MIFTVTYREKSGAKTEVAIEAATRAECVSECRARGIAPLSVREGRSGGASIKSASDVRGKRLRKIFAICLLAAAAAIVAVVLLWFCGRRAAALSVKPQSDRGAKVVKALGRTKQVHSAAPVVTNAAPQVATNAQPVRPQNAQPARPPKRNKAKEIADARRAIQATNGYVRVKKDRPFKTAADQAMAMLMSIPPGQPVPPIPIRPGAEEEFRKMVDTPIEILDTDSEKVRVLKQSVQECRQELKRLLDQGLSLQQIIAEHRSLANENAQIRRDAAREAREMLEKGDREGAEQYVTKINAALSQMGIPAISMPMTREERHKQAMERIAERKRKAEEKKKGQKQ